MDAHLIFDLCTRTVVACSILHTILPPYEVFSDFPGAQKYYKLLLNFISHVAIARRSALYPSISTMGGQFPSLAAISGRRSGRDRREIPPPALTNPPKTKPSEPTSSGPPSDFGGGVGE